MSEMSNQAVVQSEQKAVQAHQPQGIAPMVQMVADGRLTIDQLDHLMALQERHEAAEAKREYNTAMAHFRAEVPPALRDGKGERNNTYATFGSVMSAINGPLGNNGFNVEFDHDQDLDKNTLKVICTITHSGGHSTSTSLTVRVQKLGSANEVQSLGGNVSYLKRYCVCSLTGLATEDNDAASAQAAPAKPVDMLTESDMADIRAECERAGKDFDKYLIWASTKFPLLNGVLQAEKPQKLAMIAQIRKAAKKAAEAAEAAE